MRNYQHSSTSFKFLDRQTWYNSCTKEGNNTASGVGCIQVNLGTIKNLGRASWVHVQAGWTWKGKLYKPLPHRISLHWVRTAINIAVKHLKGPSFVLGYPHMDRVSANHEKSTGSLTIKYITNAVSRECTEMCKGFAFSILLIWKTILSSWEVWIGFWNAPIGVK